jgi:WD40 repeat protein
MDFDDLRVRVTLNTDQHYVVTAANVDGEEASATFELPFGATDLENLVLRIGRARQARRAMAVAEVKRVETFGDTLFSTVFQGDVKDVLRKAKARADSADRGLRLVLSLRYAPDLLDVPWEFLYDRPYFFGLQRRTPLVRYLELPHARRPVPIHDRVHILGMISSPTDYDTLDVAHERRLVEEALAPLLSTGRAEVAWLERATLAELNRALQLHETHIFHFVGHGGFDDASSEGLLVLEGPNQTAHEVPGSYLGPILSDHPSLRLVVLNACEGARTSARDPFSGVATSLIERDIPAVVAMQFEITDDAALVFASAFYRALVERGERVDTAMASARIEIFANNPDGLEWATPVLYSRVLDGTLFDFSAQVLSGADRPATVTITNSEPPEPPQPETPAVEEPVATTPPTPGVLDVSVPAEPPLLVHEAVRCEHRAAITSAALSGDGRWLVTSGVDARVVVWDSATGAPVTQWSIGRQAVDVAISSDGSLVAAAVACGCSVFASATGQQVATLAPGGDGTSYVRACAFSPDGASVVAGNDAGVVEAWRVGAWRSRARQTLAQRRHAVTALRFHAGGGRIIVGAYTGAVWFWDYGVSKLFPLSAATTGGTVSDVVYLRDSPHIAVASGDGSLLVVDATENRRVARIEVGAALTTVDSGPDGLVVVAGDDHRLRGYTIDGAMHVTQPTTGTLSRIRFSTNGRGVLTAGASGVASMWVIDSP